MSRSASAQAPAAGRLDRRRHSGCGPSVPNQVWAFGFQFDQTADGRVIRLLNVVDEFTREALEMLVERSIDADTTVEALERPGRRPRRSRSTYGWTTARR